MNVEEEVSMGMEAIFVAGLVLGVEELGVVVP